MAIDIVWGANTPMTRHSYIFVVAAIKTTNTFVVVVAMMRLVDCEFAVVFQRYIVSRLLVTEIKEGRGKR